MSYDMVEEEDVAYSLAYSNPTSSRSYIPNILSVPKTDEFSIPGFARGLVEYRKDS